MKDSKVNPPPFRVAELSDTLFVARLTREFYEKVGGIYRIPGDYESFVVMADAVIRNGICIVGPTSCAGALMARFPGNQHELVANVLFFYFQQKREITIFYAFLEALRAAGATHIDAASHFPENTIGKFYKKLGLVPTETHWMASIDICCKRIPKLVRADDMKDQPQPTEGT